MMMSIDTMVDFYIKEAEARGELREENDKLRVRIEVLKAGRDSWKAGYENLFRASERLSLGKADTIEGLREELEELRAENGRLQAERDNWKDYYQRLFSAHGFSRGRSHDAIEELRAKVTESQDSADAWYRKATELQRENGELRHDNQSLQSISAYWLAEHDKQEAEKATLQDSLSAIKAVVDSATEDLLGG